MLDDNKLAGMFSGILKTDPVRLRDVFELRRMLEPEVAALAAVRRTDVDLARMRRLLDEQAAASPDDYPSLDGRFHMHIARATGNEAVWEMAAVLSDILSESRTGPPAPDRREASLTAHAAILVALEQGDPEAARSAMRAHLDRVGDLTAPGSS